uniref:carotenoid oxygenase family protein n=1 Tax=uncultured Altererythrobacter sp. TaxID=500840 RepID=UPI002608BE17|nr:carotenoid oxygenase family protein [uncultured Altererythrobacter sp.]
MASPAQVAQQLPFWLAGNFAPVFEERSDSDLRVTGEIPRELNGLYVRNGANPPSGKSMDWFLGCGMLHGVEIADGKPRWYRNCYVQTCLLEQEMPDPKTRSQLENSIANTHVIAHAGKILALAELNLPIEVTSELETVGPYRFGGKLNGNMTAHPKVCAVTGEMMFFGYSMTPPFLKYYRVASDGALVQETEIAVKGPTMMHDFCITGTRTVFLDLPVVFDLEERRKGGLGIRHDDDYGARIGVMPRTGTSEDVQWFEIDPCYVYHTLNAYDDGDEVVVEGCRMVGYMAKGMVKPPVPVPYRWRLNIASGTVIETQIDDIGLDFPVVPDRLSGQRHRYGYFAQFGDAAPTVDGFHKLEMATGQRQSHMLRNGRTGSEARFVPAASAASEDDGYLLSYVYDPGSATSELVILDAANLSDDPIARIHLPARVPAGFHGSWIPH